MRLKKETVWLDAHQMAKLFDVDRTGAVRHIRNIYKSGELKRDSTCAKIAQVAKDGKVRTIDFYNQEKEILSLLAGYAKTLRGLEQYDKGKLKKPKEQKAQLWTAKII
ncbi:hypothetical protein BMS3Abin15_01031 [bacterium BMS3Abin15]|nr:hypothetical protein BMS3Abin15_01031 [bacterium BMS3Abin15]